MQIIKKQLEKLSDSLSVENREKLKNGLGGL